MNDTIRKEKLFDQSIDKIWNAISKAEEISTWFIPADFKAEVGYKYTFTAPKEDNCTKIMGEVKSAAPYKLVYSWIVENTDIETIVSWVLEKVGDKTQLILEHSGISNYPDETAISMFNSFNGGWNNCMKQLDKYLMEVLHEV